jgi:hypothetical protein
MLREVCVLMAVPLLCLSSPARAQESPAETQEDYSRRGCYLGLAGNVAFLPNAEDWLKSLTGLNTKVDESLGLHARGGCRDKWVGFEVHYEWLEGFEAKVDGLDIGKADGWALTLDLKLYPLAALEDKLPATAKRFHPFTTVGLGYLTLDTFDEEWDFAARLGGGLEVYLTRNIALNVDATYVLPMSDSICSVPDCQGSDLAYLSVGWGLLYRF